ncbi:class I adenylate cyclase [Methylomonas sp. SURF-2]|uniref:Class I adenylate cyclase n=1 Tax=Methylomonas subterranea TaxID=2952225 RepID=A0ABT1TB16_9GAMM|nr:class I adenylate cyclase [Methylomonas sp. SURF-2]MCQ8102650.1 class I adenylate cyclase [Methylomonas sp. SURF-2]
MTSRFPPIHLGAPGEEISRKDLHAIAQRFKYFNQSRLLRMREFMQPRQHDFLHLLPLLFHQNHPLLPGFVSLETPAGIPDYQPGKQAVEAARQFSKGFIYKRKALRSYPIQSLFLMGSVGSMAFSKESDIDIWLCHQPGLSGAELAELRQKSLLVEKWAESLKLEVHFFLVNSEQFKQGENTPISSESSGEAQHYLLLEEFYRTSVYIAGRVPVWWLVPPLQEKNYAGYVDHLLENRFISEQEVLDFGGLQDMPQAEFVSATLWHIYKSLNSPHKALLKLFLMESYAMEFPEPQWLCVSMKQAIYTGDFSVDTLDAYLQIYNKVDDYLRRAGSTHRLDLARECFYIKITGSSSGLPDSKTRQMRNDFMEMIARRWHWPENLLGNLATGKFWDIGRAGTEHSVIRDQLQQCLRIILKITGDPGDHPEQHDDLKLLSRKLRAFLDLRPGKIEILTTRSMVYNKPDIWAIAEIPLTDTETVWCLYDGRLPPQPVRPELAIKQSETLLELLSWAVLNGLYKRDVNLHFHARSCKIPDADLNRLLTELSAFLSTHLPNKETGLDVYRQPNRWIASFLVINLGEVLAIDDNQQQFMMSERSDPLSYGESRHCFVQGLQKISISSWGEVTSLRYNGLEGVFTCLSEIFNETAKPMLAENLRVVCYTRGRGRSIALRIETIFNRLLAGFSARRGREAGRYILPAGGGYCCFKLRNDALGFYFLENHSQLLNELSSPHNQFSPVIFDEFVLEQTYIPFLYQYNRPDKLQIFYHATSKHVAVYIIDEHGSLFVRQHSNANPQHILVHYCLFIKTLQLQAKLPEYIGIECYEIQKNSTGVVSCHPTEVKPGNTALDLRVRIVVDRSRGPVVYCNERKFDLAEAGAYQSLKNHIFGFRKNREDYPFHITEVDAPGEILGIQQMDQAQSLHYLNYKQKIEDKLNI